MPVKRSDGDVTGQLLGLRVNLECGSSIPQRQMEVGMLKSSCICRRSTSPAHLLHPNLQEGKLVRYATWHGMHCGEHPGT